MEEQSNVFDSEYSVGESVKIKNFCQDCNLELLQGNETDYITFRSALLNRPGLILSGFDDYFGDGRVQMIGNAEYYYIKSLPDDKKEQAIEMLFSKRVPCVIYTRSINPSSLALEVASRYNTPVFLSHKTTTALNTDIADYLEKLLAPMKSVHATFLEISGIGVLLTGKSGLGKSETALELIHRGHRLVGDDAVIVKRIGDQLIGTAPERIKFFMEEVKTERREKVVCYPMLGKQKGIVGEISLLGFKFVGIAVLRFLLHETTSRQILNIAAMGELPKDYSIKYWEDKYMNDAVRVVQNAFSTSADALFDTRFASLDGTYDILNKIVTNVYADFFPAASSVLLYKGKPAGFCFANVTGGRIVNIPIFAIAKEHQSKGLSKYLLAETLKKVLTISDENQLPITEINTNTETNNFQALKMYRNLGFKEDYNYPQSYLPATNKF